jgi:hypothetical protein
VKEQRALIKLTVQMSDISNPKAREVRHGEISNLMPLNFMRIRHLMMSWYDDLLSKLR